jgi:hypothetical protein
MKKIVESFLLTGLISLWFVAIAAAQSASQPVTTTAPATRPVKADPKIEAILDRLERQGEKIQNIKSKILYMKKDLALESVQKYGGILRFMKAEPNPRFFICFDRFQHDALESDLKKWHVFDGEWYIEASERTRQIVKRQVVRPGEPCEAFRIGQGPFPLPFGQKKKDILRHFSVKLIPPEKDKDKKVDHLECTPREGTELAKRYAAVHFYIDRELNLPVRVHTVDKEELTEITAIFPRKSIQINTGMAASKLNLPEQDLLDRGFSVKQHYLTDKEKGSGAGIGLP